MENRRYSRIFSASLLLVIGLTVLAKPGKAATSMTGATGLVNVPVASLIPDERTSFGVGYTHSAPAHESEALSHRIAEIMVSHGFENIRVRTHHAALTVEYENRVYFWEKDAVKVITGEIMDAASDVQTLTLVPKRDDVSLFQLVVSRDDHLASVGGRDVVNSLVAPWEVKAAGHAYAGGKYNSSVGKVDITLHPEFSSLLGRINDPFIYRLAISPECSTFLGRGLKAYARVRFLLHDEVKREKRRVSLARLFLDYTHRSANTTFANLSGGYFDDSRYGLSSEALYLLWNDRAGVGGTAALLGTMYYWDGTLYFTRPWKWTALGNLHYSLPSWDLLFTARFGQFLYEDRGASVEITRFFHNTSITMFATKTDLDSIVGIGLQLLTYPRRHLAPHRVRVKLPTTLNMLYRHDENNAGIVFAPGRDINYTTQRFWLTDLE